MTAYVAIFCVLVLLIPIVGLWLEHRMSWRELNAWGRSCGVERQPGESYHSYRERVLDRAGAFWRVP